MKPLFVFAAVMIGAALFLPPIGVAIAAVVAGYFLFDQPFARLLGMIVGVTFGVVSLAFAADVATAAAGGGWGDFLLWLWSTLSQPLAVSGLVGLLLANTPQGADGTIWDTVRTVLNYIASNYGSAKNIRTA